MRYIIRTTAIAGGLAVFASTAFAVPNQSQEELEAASSWQQGQQQGQREIDTRATQEGQIRGSEEAARMGAPLAFNQQDQNELNWQQQQQRFQRQNEASTQQQSPQKQASASNIRYDSKVQLERGASAADRKAVSQAAGFLLMHVNNAREAIENNNSDIAAQNVEKALTLARIIEENAPVYRIETSISSGNNQYQSSDTVRSTIVPVYTELERSTLLGPIAKAKGKNLSRGGGETEAQESGSPVVRNVQLSSASIELDAALARRALQNAQEELRSNSPENADQALASIQRGVYLSYTATNMPLVKAHENLVLARAYATQGQTTEAQATLQAAKNALEVYQRDVGPTRSKDIDSVKRELDQLTNSVRKNDSQITQRLVSVEEKVTGWIS